MKFLQLFFVFISISFFSQDSLPILMIENSLRSDNDEQETDVRKALKLKEDEIAVTFYTNGGLSYHLYIDNFIFKKNGSVSRFQYEIFFKRGKKRKRKKIVLSETKEVELKEIIRSDFFIDFSKFTQSDFKYSENNHQICGRGYIDDSPENFVMITQNEKQSNIMVYLPKNNIKCSSPNSPLIKFVELHELFGINLER